MASGARLPGAEHAARPGRGEKECLKMPAPRFQVLRHGLPRREKRAPEQKGLFLHNFLSGK